MNASEPPVRCRENVLPVKTAVLLLRRISVAETCLPAAWQASYRGHDFYSGLITELGKSCRYVKGKAQAGEILARPKTDALQDGGLPRSSDEAPVMGVERRGWRLVGCCYVDNHKRWEDLLTEYQLTSRMMGDYHVRFCEGLGGKFPRSTRQNNISRQLSISP
jgi:hypothetical protein